MQYDTKEPTSVTFDSYGEIQALTYATGEMRRAFPDDPEAIAAYEGTLLAMDLYGIGRGESENRKAQLHGKSAASVLSIVRRWVELGPPEATGEITDAARAKSYKTACAIVAMTVAEPESRS